MRRLRQWILPLLALLLTVTGAALPYAVSTLQDSTVEALRENRMLNDVSLTLMEGDGIQEVLHLLAGSANELEWMGKTNLTEEEVASAVKEILRQLYKSRLVGPEFQFIPEDCSVYAEPHIIMSMDESDLSAVVWLCWLEEIPSNWFMIDDRTGKMVRICLNETALGDSISIYNKSAYLWVTDQEKATQRAEQWRIFLSEYYGIELLFSDSEDYDDGYSMYFDLAFDAGGQRGRWTVRL